MEGRGRGIPDPGPLCCSRLAEEVDDAMSHKRSTASDSGSEDGSAEGTETEVTKTPEALVRERMTACAKNSEMSLRAWVVAQDEPEADDEHGVLMKLYLMLRKLASEWFAKNSPLTCARLLRVLSDDGKGNATFVQGLLVSMRSAIHGPDKPTDDEGSATMLSWAEMEQKGVRLAFLSLVEHMRAVVPHEKEEMALASRVPLDSPGPATHRISNYGPSSSHFGAMLSEDRMGAHERREKKHEQRMAYEKKQCGMIMPASIKASRDQCEEFSQVHYQSSSAAPTIPTLEKVIEKGAAIAMLDGRTGDYSVSLANAISALKTCYSGPAPQHDMTFGDNEGSCEIFIGREREASVKTKVVPAMLDVTVADELIVSVQRLCLICTV